MAELGAKEATEAGPRDLGLGFLSQRVHIHYYYGIRP